MQPQRNLDLFSFIVAMTEHGRVIGRNGTLPWRIPSDMKRFKDITTGHPVIMGRESWESIPLKFRPLSGRTNIVMTRQPGYTAHGGIAVSSMEDAYATAIYAPGADEIFVIGGGEIYQQLFPFATKVYMTKVYAEVEGDTFFPELDGEWRCTNALRQGKWLKEDDFETSFHTYERISS